MRDRTYLYTIMDCYSAAAIVGRETDMATLDKLMIAEGSRCGMNALETDDLLRERREGQMEQLNAHLHAVKQSGE